LCELSPNVAQPLSDVMAIFSDQVITLGCEMLATGNSI